MFVEDGVSFQRQLDLPEQWLSQNFKNSSLYDNFRNPSEGKTTYAFNLALFLEK